MEPQNNIDIWYPYVRNIYMLYNCFKSFRKLKMKYNKTWNQLYTLQHLRYHFIFSAYKTIKCAYQLNCILKYSFKYTQLQTMFHAKPPVLCPSHDVLFYQSPNLSLPLPLLLLLFQGIGKPQWHQFSKCNIFVISIK